MGEGDSERPPVNGVARSDITIPHNLRLTCVVCEGIKTFDPATQTESGLTYECGDCGHELHLELDP